MAGQGEIQQPIRTVRVELQRPLGRGRGRGVFSKGSQGGAEIHMRLGIVGLELHGPAETGHGLSVALPGTVHHTEVVVADRILRTSTRDHLNFQAKTIPWQRFGVIPARADEASRAPGNLCMRRSRRIMNLFKEEAACVACESAACAARRGTPTCDRTGNDGGPSEY